MNCGAPQTGIWSVNWKRRILPNSRQKALKRRKYLSPGAATAKQIFGDSFIVRALLTRTKSIQSSRASMRGRKARLCRSPSAAADSCGCHDNRLDKASWNEQWMGYMPPDKIWSKDPNNWYSQCSNIDNAYRLKGKLFLIVGETDHNVPPESTLRFADALIKANKDFDLLVIPGGD